MKYFDYDAYIKQLEELVSIDSGSFDPEGVDKVAEAMARKYEELGLTVTKKRFDERAGYCLEVRNYPEEESIDILMVGHMDTVFPKGTVAKRPFTMDEKKAYGPGVDDMKSGLLNMYYVVKELVKENTKLHLCLALNCDEEISSRYSNPWISELARHAKCGLVFEPARKNGAIVSDRKGLARYVIDFKGIYAHAGVNPQDGASAIHEMAEWITRLVPLNDYEHGTSLNVGIVKGGMGANTLAENAQCEVDIRFTNIEACHKIEAAFENLRTNPIIKGVTATVTRVGFRPPMASTERSRSMLEIMRQEGEKCGVDVKWVTTGGGSDGNFMAFEGCSVMDAVGPVGDGAHGDKEFIWLETIKPRTEMVYRTLMKLEEKGYFA